MGLDLKLARILLKPFGTKSENVLLGFLLVTGIFSMFLSNTATAAMMLTFLTPILKQLPASGKGKIDLALSIPIGANIGGIGTPIGTPPNAIALKALNDPEGLNMGIGFGEWMMFMFPLGLALQDTNLAAHLIETIPFNTWLAIVMLIGSGILCYALSNFISNTATAALLVPILTVIGTAAASTLAPYGGVSPLLIGIALSASLAMVLPISTPPNALAHATGMIEQNQMMKVGIIMGIIGMAAGYTVLITLGKMGVI